MTRITIQEEIIKEMIRNGVVLGHKKSKTHPKMKQFIIGNKNELELLNPTMGWESIEKAIEVMKEKLSQGGTMLLVGTKPAAKVVIKQFADEMGYPFVISRWLGGTLTNFPVIKARIVHYEGLKDKQAKGAFAKYTKKEQLSFVKEIAKMSETFEGLLKLKKLPELVFVVDGEAHLTAIREARRLRIPIVAIIDTNDNPSLVDYPIVANDHSRKSIEWVVEKVKESILSINKKSE
jgi:small subunit ribosomal protein S2